MARSPIFRLQPLAAAIALTCMCCSFPVSDLLALRNQYYEDGQNTLLKEVRNSLDDTRHTINNHETELRICDEKLKNIEVIIDGLREQVVDSVQSHKDQVKSGINALDERISSLETLVKGLVNDLRLFRTHANETSSALSQYKQKIVELEASLAQQAQHFDHMQTAMRSIMEAIALEKSGRSNSATDDQISIGVYRVKAGDNLKKIADDYQTTVSALKSLNNLTNDRIVTGQTLKIPKK